MIIPRSLRKIGRIHFPADQTRYAACVHVHRDAAGKPWVITTDGRYLLAATFDEPVVQGIENPKVVGFDVNIPLCAWETMFSYAKRVYEPEHQPSQIIVDETSTETVDMRVWDGRCYCIVRQLNAPGKLTGAKVLDTIRKHQAKPVEKPLATITHIPANYRHLMKTLDNIGANKITMNVPEKVVSPALFTVILEDGSRVEGAIIGCDTPKEAAK